MQVNSMKLSSVQLNSIQLQLNSIQFSSAQLNSIKMQFNPMQFQLYAFQRVQCVAMHIIAFHLFLCCIRSLSCCLRFTRCFTTYAFHLLLCCGSCNDPYGHLSVGTAADNLFLRSIPLCIIDVAPQLPPLFLEPAQWRALWPRYVLS